MPAAFVVTKGSMMLKPKLQAYSCRLFQIKRTVVSSNKPPVSSRGINSSPSFICLCYLYCFLFECSTPFRKSRSLPFGPCECHVVRQIEAVCTCVEVVPDLIGAHLGMCRCGTGSRRCFPTSMFNHPHPALCPILKPLEGFLLGERGIVCLHRRALMDW